MLELTILEVSTVVDDPARDVAKTAPPVNSATRATSGDEHVKVVVDIVQG